MRWLLPILACLACTANTLAADHSAEENARRSFRHALELYDDHDFDGALVELRRAYELAPNFRILYNLAQVAEEKRDYAGAIDYHGRYLRQGADEIPVERRREVEAAIERLRARVGTVSIRWDGPPARVFIDGDELGRTPLRQAVPANVGQRRLEIRPNVGEPQFMTVDVPGGESVTASFHYTPPASARGPVATPPPAEAKPPISARHGWGQTILWTSVGVTAVGAITAGVLAYSFSRNLRDGRENAPASRADLDASQRRVRIAAYACDGLAATSLVLATVALLRGDPPEPSYQTNVLIGSVWPPAVTLSTKF